MKNKPTNKKTIRFIFALCSVLLLSFLTQLNTKPVSAEEEPTITINTISDTAVLDLTPTGTEGTFATSVDSDIVFNVSTNNFSGYSLSVTTVDNTRALVNGSNMIGSIGSALTSIEFNDASNDNKWGFKPNKFYDVATNAVVDNSGEDGVFLPAPASAVQLDKTSAANSASNSYSISVGMRVNLDIKSGEYTGALNIISVANPAAYIINFDNNATAGETITDFPENIDNTTFGSFITLPNNTPTREHYTFTGWCNVAPTNTNGIDACTGGNAITYQPGGSYEISHLAANNTTLYAMWQIDTFTQSVKYRFENIDGTFTDWTDAEDEIINYGDTFTWNPADKITGFDGGPYQDITPISYTVEDDQANEITFIRKTFTVTKRYKLEDADGNYPDEFTADGTLSIRYGDSYTYSKCVNYYDCKESEVTDITEDTTIDLLLERKKYSVYVQAGTDIKSVTGGGTYRWGQIITLTANRNDDNNCRVFHEETWTKSGYGNFVNNLDSGNTVQFEVGKGTATLRANATHEDIPQTITFSAPNGETLFFDEVEYHDGDTTQAICGNHSISATIKELPMEERIYLQDITPATCPTTKTRVYDRRDEESYYIQKLADGNCWMQDNLRLDSATSVPLTTANTNMSPVYNFELPEGWPLDSGYSYATSILPRTTTAHKERGLAPWWTAEAGSFADAQWRNTTFTVENSTTLTFQEVSRVGVYYNFCAVTAGTWCANPSTDEQPEGFVDDGHIYDICPAGWRLPVSGLNDDNEFRILRLAYDDDDTFLDATNTRLGSGMVNEVNTVWHQTNIGYYWSGTPNSKHYGLYLGTWRSDSRINVQMSADRTVGHAARCMIKTPDEP